MKYLIFFLILLLPSCALAGDLVYKFKSPSFSGVGTSAHFLTIENQEHTRKAEIKAKKIAAEEKAIAAKKNKNFRKFLDNMESRIYAEFSKQLTDSMFGEACGTTYSGGATVAPSAQELEGHSGGTNCTGTMTFNGTSMTYTKDSTNDIVTLVIDGPDGSETITLPLNDFQF